MKVHSGIGSHYGKLPSVTGSKQNTSRPKAAKFVGSGSAHYINEVRNSLLHFSTSLARRRTAHEFKPLPSRPKHILSGSKVEPKLKSDASEAKMGSDQSVNF